MRNKENKGLMIYPTDEELALINNKFLASGERSRSFWIIKQLIDVKKDLGVKEDGQGL